MSKALVLGIAALALSAGAASAQGANYVYPYSGYAPYGYGYAPYGYAATAPLYDYAASGYGYGASVVAPGQSGTTIVIVTPGSAYAAPTVAAQPLYSYAPGYWGGYRYGGYGRAGWWR